MEIPLGAMREERILVTPDNTINFLGVEGGRVLGTPYMIGYMETTARDLIKEHLPEGEDSVGTLVNVKHLAATPIGMSVRFTAEVIAINGRRVTCRVEAWDEAEKVGEGEHERFVINVRRFAARAQAKAAARA